MIILATLILALAVLLGIAAVQEESAGRIFGLAAIGAVFMATPWAAMTVYRFFAP